MRCSVALFFIFPAVAFAQNVKIEAKHGAVGDKTGIKIESSLVVDIIKKDDTGESTTTHSIDKTERFSQEVVAAENGASLTLKVKCTSGEFERVNVDRREKGNTDLHGKEFIVKRSAGKPAEVTLPDGSPAIGAESVGGWE